MLTSLAGLLISGSAVAKDNECRELSYVEPSRYDLVMKTHGDDMVDRVHDELEMDYYGKLCEYDGEFYRFGDLEVKKPKIDCIILDYVDENNNPVEWQANFSLEVKYPDFSVEYDVGLFFDEEGSVVNHWYER